MSNYSYFKMSKGLFIVISILLLLFMILAPEYYVKGGSTAEPRWIFPNMEIRAFMFACIILPAFFLAIYPDAYDFNVAPTYLPMIEFKNLLGTVAFIVLCASRLLFVLSTGDDLSPLESGLSLYTVVAPVLVAIRSLFLDGPWGMYINQDFSYNLSKFFRTALILLFLLIVVLSYGLSLLGVAIPNVVDIDAMFADVKIVITENFTATFTILLVAGALALIVVIFAINQVVGLFGGVAAAVGDVARGDFGGATTRSKKVNCHNCKSFHFDSKGKPSCYTCGRLWSTTQDCPYYDEK